MGDDGEGAHAGHRRADTARWEGLAARPMPNVLDSVTRDAAFST
jgi:hypothetical protein